MPHTTSIKGVSTGTTLLVLALLGTFGRDVFPLAGCYLGVGGVMAARWTEGLWMLGLGFTFCIGCVLVTF